MKTHSLPGILAIILLLGNVCPVENASAQPSLENGLSKCLVYTFSDTQTSKGRLRDYESGKVQYSALTVRNSGLMVIGPRTVVKAPFYNYSTSPSQNTEVDLKTADTMEYTLLRREKRVFRQSAAYAIGALNTGRTSTASKALLVASWYNKGSSYLSTSVTDYDAQGEATLVAPYSGLTPIWHAPVLKRSNKMTESIDATMPIGFARSATDDSKNTIDALQTSSNATYIFDKKLSELVKSAATLKQAQDIIEKYLRSPAGGRYIID